MISEVKYLFGKIRPKRFRVTGTFGFNDPATTGRILMVLGILYPIIGNNIDVTPDFEKEVLEGSILLKGRLSLYFIIVIAIRVFFNKDIRRLYKRLKMEE